MPADDTAETQANRGPRLQPFHVLPPRTLTLKLPDEAGKKLDAYTAFYNEEHQTSVQSPDVAAAIIQQFLTRDRAFQRYLRRRQPTGDNDNPGSNGQGKAPTS